MKPEDKNDSTPAPAPDAKKVPEILHVDDLDKVSGGISRCPTADTFALSRCPTAGTIA